ncbi:hypothetical protein SNEBB_004303, partial [Seison nebaliae]
KLMTEKFNSNPNNSFPGNLMKNNGHRLNTMNNRPLLPYAPTMDGTPTINLAQPSSCYHVGGNGMGNGMNINNALELHNRSGLDMGDHLNEMNGNFDNKDLVNKFIVNNGSSMEMNPSNSLSMNLMQMKTNELKGAAIHLPFSITVPPPTIFPTTSSKPCLSQPPDFHATSIERKKLPVRCVTPQQELISKDWLRVWKQQSIYVDWLERQIRQYKVNERISGMCEKLCRNNEDNCKSEKLNEIHNLLKTIVPVKEKMERYPKKPTIVPMATEHRTITENCLIRISEKFDQNKLNNNKINLFDQNVEEVTQEVDSPIDLIEWQRKQIGLLQHLLTQRDLEVKQLRCAIIGKFSVYRQMKSFAPIFNSISKNELNRRKREMHLNYSRNSFDGVSTLDDLNIWSDTEQRHMINNCLWIDPTLGLIYEKIKKERDDWKRKYSDLESELHMAKWNETSSNGRRLLERCRALLKENEELGQQLLDKNVDRLKNALYIERFVKQEELIKIIKEMKMIIGRQSSQIHFLELQLQKTNLTQMITPFDHSSTSSLIDCEKDDDFDNNDGENDDFYALDQNNFENSDMETTDMEIDDDENKSENWEDDDDSIDEKKKDDFDKNKTEDLDEIKKSDSNKKKKNNSEQKEKYDFSKNKKSDQMEIFESSSKKNDKSGSKEKSELKKKDKSESKKKEKSYLMEKFQSKKKDESDLMENFQSKKKDKSDSMEEEQSDPIEKFESKKKEKSDPIEKFESKKKEKSDPIEKFESKKKDKRDSMENFESKKKDKRDSMENFESKKKDKSDTIMKSERNLKEKVKSDVMELDVNSDREERYETNNEDFDEYDEENYLEESGKLEQNEISLKNGLVYYEDEEDDDAKYYDDDVFEREIGVDEGEDEVDETNDEFEKLLKNFKIEEEETDGEFESNNLRSEDEKNVYKKIDNFIDGKFEESRKYDEMKSKNWKSQKEELLVKSLVRRSILSRIPNSSNKTQLVSLLDKLEESSVVISSENDGRKRLLVGDQFVSDGKRSRRCNEERIHF